jgi:hypothetical protein
MGENPALQQAVETIVTQVLEETVPQLRSELVRRVLDEVAAHAPAEAEAVAEPAPAENSSSHLLKALSTIHSGTTQREILRALLDSTVRYSGRAALFVVKGGAATGWQGRAFSNNDEIKDFSLDVTNGLASRALQSRTAFSGPVEEMDQRFISTFGSPSGDEVWVLPLLLKDKVAALVYADAGNEAGSLDASALELLVAATGSWLEVNSLRKQAQKDMPQEAAPERGESAAAPVQTVSSFSDPFAGHAPRHVVATPEPAPAAMAVAESDATPVMADSAAAAAAPATDPFAQMSPEDADVHRKAVRFARLLVDEIKLYNQAKVTEGRKNKDVYDRLKEDIEKSRATYMKRYGNTVAASGNYFAAEVVRSLAEDDISIMGANFRR